MKIDRFRSAWKKLNTGVLLSDIRRFVLTSGKVHLEFLTGDEAGMDIDYLDSSEFCKSLGLDPYKVHKIEGIPGQLTVTRQIVFNEHEDDEG